MYKIITITFLLSFSFLFSASAQHMDSEKLQTVIKKISDTLNINGNTLHFVVKEKILICIYDEKANRMRIISPIVEREKLNEDELLNALVANFHSALDVKYALSDEIIWSVFTHPLKELSEHQLIDAIQQVYTASMTFGATYSSTNLIFPGNTKKVEAKKTKKI